ncbi:Phosphoribosyl-AMP cyclohydrolase [Candidatus Hodgkinia cicadicola]|nr:Phosphoribosyl-AMP cyclohydrolase [Candidatus Hodgkinia cicadicola]
MLCRWDVDVAPKFSCARLRLKSEVGGDVCSLAKACADCDLDLLLFSVAMFCGRYSCYTLGRLSVCNRLWQQACVRIVCIPFWLMPLTCRVIF